jgi:hypothetical protein
MNGTAIEERLHRLADGVEAPATAVALDAIERRTQVLRRRRRVGLVAAVGVAMVGGLSLQGSDPSGVEIDPQDDVDPPGENGLPAFTLDLDGWDVIAARDEHDVPYGIGAPPPADDSTEAQQIFRVPGDLLGPSILVRHSPAAETIADMFSEHVTIGGVPGKAWVDGDDVAVTWNRHHGRTRVWLKARNLPLDQVVEFAEGLEPLDADISLPPRPGDRFGFDATVQIAGMEEEPLTPRAATVDRRYVELAQRNDRGLVEITVDDPGGRVFEEELGALVGGVWSQVTVGGEPARMLVRGHTVPPSGNIQAELFWMVDDTTRVTVKIRSIAENELPGVLDGLRGISDDEWAALVTHAPGSTTTTLGPGGVTVPPQPTAP